MMKKIKLFENFDQTQNEGLLDWVGLGNKLKKFKTDKSLEFFIKNPKEMPDRGKVYDFDFDDGEGVTALDLIFDKVKAETSLRKFIEVTVDAELYIAGVQKFINKLNLQPITQRDADFNQMEYDNDTPYLVFTDSGMDRYVIISFNDGILMSNKNDEQTDYLLNISFYDLCVKLSKKISNLTYVDTKGKVVPFKN